MLEGFRFLPEYFPPGAQKALVAEVLAILETNPLYTATMPRSGKPMSVRMTNLGPLGWVSDIAGYRYQPTHPFTNEPWTPIPQALLDLWNEVADYPAPPQACLVNWYGADSRLGGRRGCRRGRRGWGRRGELRLLRQVQRLRRALPAEGASPPQDLRGIPAAKRLMESGPGHARRGARVRKTIPVLLSVRIIVLLIEQQHGRGRTSDRVVSEAIDRVRAPNRRPRAIVLREALQLGLEGPHGRG